MLSVVMQIPETVTPKCGVYYEYIWLYPISCLYLILFLSYVKSNHSFDVFVRISSLGREHIICFCTCDNHGYVLMVVCYRMTFLTSILSDLHQGTLWLIYTQNALICFPLYHVLQALNLTVVNFIMQCACCFTLWGFIVTVLSRKVHDPSVDVD